MVKINQAKFQALNKDVKTKVDQFSGQVKALDGAFTKFTSDSDFSGQGAASVKGFVEMGPQKFANDLKETLESLSEKLNATTQSFENEVDSDTKAIVSTAALTELKNNSKSIHTGLSDVIRDANKAINKANEVNGVSITEVNRSDLSSAYLNFERAVSEAENRIRIWDAAHSNDSEVISEGFKSIDRALKEARMKYRDTGITHAPDPKDQWARRSIKDFTKAIGGFSDDTNNKTVGPVRSISEFVVNLIKGFVGLHLEAAKKIADFVVGTAKQIDWKDTAKSFVQDLTSNGLEAYGNFLISSAKEYGRVSNVVGDAVTAVGTKLPQKGVSEALGITPELASLSKAGKLLKGLGKGLGVGTAILDFLGTFSEDYSKRKSIGKATTHAGLLTALGILGGIIGSAIAGFFGLPVIATVAVVALAGALVGAIGKVAYDNNWLGIRTISDKVGEVLDNVGNAIKSFVEDNWDTIKAVAVPVAIGGLTAISPVTGIGLGIAHLVQKNKAGIERTAKGLSTMAGKFVKGLIKSHEKLREYRGRSWKIAKDGIGNAIQRTTETVGTGLQIAKDKFGNAVQGVKEVVEQEVDTIKENVREGLGHIGFGVGRILGIV